MTRHLGAVGLLFLAAAQGAQSQSAVRRAAETITESDIRRRINVIADDSMGGRNTPSPGLNQTAQYIAGEFRRFGLKPGGDSGTYLLSYPIATTQLLAERSTVEFNGPGGNISSTLAQGAALISGPTRATVRGKVVLVGGVVVADSVPQAAVRDQLVVYVPAASAAGGVRGRGSPVQRMLQLGARGVVVIVNSDSVFATYRRFQARVRTTVGDGDGGSVALALKESTVVAQLPDAADQFAQLRGAATLVVAPMPEWEGVITVQDTTLTRTYAPNVVGILEGSDPQLKHEYVVYSAHMDHVGTGTANGNACFRRVAADSLCNGADDDGSGTVGVVELAEAFSRPGARPKRSVIFLTVSGEEHGLWGSEWFATHPPVPLPQIVADLNADMIGRNWKDTIVVIGKEHSDLGSTLNRVNAAHRELNMTAIDDLWPNERFYQRSDHFNFARRGVPILFFFNGTHPDYHAASDSPDKIDAEKEARIVRLMFYVGQEVANAAERPKWVPQSYQQIVTP